jgi:hypothetical protein
VILALNFSQYLDKDVKPDLPVPPVFGQFSSDHVTQRSFKVDGVDLDEAEAADEAEKWAAYKELENARQEWDKQREEDEQEDFDRARKEEMMEMVAAVVAQTLRSFEDSKAKKKSVQPQGIKTRTGVIIRDEGARVPTELSMSRVIVSRFDRGGDANSRKKTMDKFCVALPIKFHIPSYKAFLSTDTSPDIDVGQNIVDGQTMMDTWIDWTHASDTNYIANVPIVDDYNDPRKVAAAMTYSACGTKS